MIRIEHAGFSAVQDLGRRVAAAASGVPRGGAFDEWALRRGNHLCGNQPGAAGLEFVLAGPSVLFERDARAAITGAPFPASLDGADVPAGAAFDVRPGQRLSIGKTARGARGYLCVEGGIDAPVILGSRSVSARAGIGAMLAGGDRLMIGRADAAARVAPGPPPASAPVRVIPGPQSFPGAALRTLAESVYVVTPDADRIGVRLDGPALTHPPAGAEIDPEPAIPGAVQVPGDGRPIVLGPDGPATGGYAKIATVIRADLWMLAQARPGDRLTFAICDVPAARQALAERLGPADG